MPFAGYKDFDACVRANRGKKDPQAYCAEIMRQTEKSMASVPARVFKVDEDRRLVFGWANISLDTDGEVLVDAHGDYILPEELEEAAYQFNLTFRATGEQHQGTTKGRLVESFMVTPDKLVAMGLSDSALPIGWWVGFKIDDDAAWEGVKKGVYRMFSIQGHAIRESR